MSVRERIKQLRQEARDLERESDEQERADSYVEALRRERHGYEARLARARRLGDKRERVPDGLGNWRESEQTGTQMAAAMEQHIADVDVEIRRVQ